METGTGIFAGGVGSEIMGFHTWGMGVMGKEISTHVWRKAHRDEISPSSTLEGQQHGLKTPAGSLPADASAVDMDLYDGQTLAEALKWYLQELPSPLIPPALYSDLVHMAQGKHSRALWGWRNYGKLLERFPSISRVAAVSIPGPTLH